MKENKKKSYIKRVFLSFVLMLITSLSAFSQQSLWVGQSYTFDVTSSVMGITTNMSWSTNGGYLSLSGSGLYRVITVTQYFSGTATVTCEWDYKLTSSGSYTHTKRQITISCRDNPVSISPTSLTMAPGETKYVSYRHQYDNQYTSAANAYFQSSDPSICTVSSSGEVVAKKAGTAYINVYSKISSKTSENSYCRVTVEEKQPTGVSLSQSSLSIAEGSTAQLKATVTPSGASTSLSWSSSNSDVAKVSSTGVVTGVSSGTATIKVTTTNGYSASCQVTVTPQPSSVALPSTLTITEGTTATLKPTLSPSNATTTYTWSSANPKIATVSSNGVVSGIAEGITDITVTTSNGKSAVCKVTVKEPAEPISVKLDRDYIQIATGYYIYLSPILEPADAATTYTWTSSDTSIANVSTSGSVRGLKEGEVTITVETQNGLSSACKVEIVTPTKQTEYTKVSPKVTLLKSLINKSLEQTVK